MSNSGKIFRTDVAMSSTKSKLSTKIKNGKKVLDTYTDEKGVKVNIIVTANIMGESKTFKAAVSGRFESLEEAKEGALLAMQEGTLVIEYAAGIPIPNVFISLDNDDDQEYLELTDDATPEIETEVVAPTKKGKK